jgi:hypothetical protein
MSSLVVGTYLSVIADSLMLLQTWIIPISFCAPSVFQYFSSHSFSDEFSLGVTFPTLCFLIDNPTGAEFTIKLQSKRVNYTESRVEIWNSAFERVHCPKNRCSAKLSGTFIARVVNGRYGLRYSLQGRFNNHEIQTQCGRESIPIWEGNRSFLVSFDIKSEEFECDGMVIAKTEGSRLQYWASPAAVCCVSVALLTLWLREIRAQPSVGIDPEERENEDTGYHLREGTEFMESGHPAP